MRAILLSAVALSIVTVLVPSVNAQDTTTNCRWFVGVPDGFECNVGQYVFGFCEYDCHGPVITRCWYHDVRYNDEFVHCDELS